MYKKIRLVMAVAFIVSAFFVGKTMSGLVSSESVKGENAEKKVVIDAGHGGSDPGKIGVNGCKEKDINLQIAKKVSKKLKENGIEAVMTREDENTSTQKAEDMKRRVELINESGAAFAVSIHQNSYGAENVKGAQVFYYAGSEEGKELAKILQEHFRLADVDNGRKEKENATYYMLKKTEIPTIIAECGFLSNWEEAEMLVTEEYQEKIAGIICDGIMNILQQEM